MITFSIPIIIPGKGMKFPPRGRLAKMSMLRIDEVDASPDSGQAPIRRGQLVGSGERGHHVFGRSPDSFLANRRARPQRMRNEGIPRLPFECRTDFPRIGRPQRTPPMPDAHTPTV